MTSYTSPRLLSAMALLALSFFACDRKVVLGIENDSGMGSGGGRPIGEGGSGAGPPICGDGISEGENEQCDERGGTQTCTVTCQFRNRVTDGLILLYTFQEGMGDQVFDRSGFEAPLNLTIPDTGATMWNEASLSLVSPVLIASTTTASKLVQAIQTTNELTAEAWVVPFSDAQLGPARIVTVSETQNLRNFALAQDGASFVGRARTTSTDTNGLPELRTDEIATPELVHIVYSRSSSGEEVFYVNAVEHVRRTVEGDFSEWDDSFHLAIGAEFNEELSSRAFLGTMHLIAVYSRALQEAEIRQNFDDGP